VCDLFLFLQGSWAERPRAVLSGEEDTAGGNQRRLHYSSRRLGGVTPAAGWGSAVAESAEEESLERTGGGDDPGAVNGGANGVNGVSGAGSLLVERCQALRYKGNRIPAWTDRVLWRSYPSLEKHVALSSHASHPTVLTSDHTPVSATFELQVPYYIQYI